MSVIPLRHDDHCAPDCPDNCIATGQHGAAYPVIQRMIALGQHSRKIHAGGEATSQAGEACGSGHRWRWPVGFALRCRQCARSCIFMLDKRTSRLLRMQLRPSRPRGTQGTVTSCGAVPALQYRHGCMLTSACGMTTGPVPTAAAPTRPAAPRAQAGASAVEKIAGESPMDYAKRVCACVVCLDGAHHQ